MKWMKFVALLVVLLLGWLFIPLIGSSIQGDEKINVTVTEKLVKYPNYLAEFDKAFIRATIKNENFSPDYKASHFEGRIELVFICDMGIKEVSYYSISPQKELVDGLYVYYEATIGYIFPSFGRHFNIHYKGLTHAIVTIRDIRNDEVLVIITYDKPYFAGFTMSWESDIYKKIQEEIIKVNQGRKL